MGGDHAPAAVVDGTASAARHLAVRLALVGPTTVLEQALASHPDWRTLGLEIVDAPDVVEMAESPAAAFRRKPRASIRVAADLVALGVDRPRVGLLSIGEEETKGNELTREAHRLLKSSPGNFIGNVEGRGIYSGIADVVVCDGFTGNVVLKTSEGLVDTVEALLGDELKGTFSSHVGYLLSRRAFRRFRRRVDYAEHGGAPLLGVARLAIVGHGRSSAKAVRNAIAVAYRCATSDFLRRVEHDIAASAVTNR